MSKHPVPANSLTPCPFGGNPKVAAQMGFPSCGIARPGPFFADLNLGKHSGGRKTRRAGKHKKGHMWGGRKSRRGGEEASVVAPASVKAAEIDYGPVNEEKKCPEGCKPIKKGLLGIGMFGLGGGRKSRRGGDESATCQTTCQSYNADTDPTYSECYRECMGKDGGRKRRKSRRRGRKSRRGGRKSRRGGRKFR
tara:strand:- start:113 stop:694 length:582 start_codon:yes stop_codon:yes gene_type:complete